MQFDDYGLFKCIAAERSPLVTDYKKFSENPLLLDFISKKKTFGLDYLTPFLASLRLIAVTDLHSDVISNFSRKVFVFVHFKDLFQRVGHLGKSRKN